MYTCIYVIYLQFLLACNDLDIVKVKQFHHTLLMAHITILNQRPEVATFLDGGVEDNQPGTRMESV